MEAPATQRRFANWRTPVLFAGIAAFIIFVVNNAILIWARYRLEDIGDGVSKAFEGSCEKTKYIMLWSHLGINVLSTILLAASVNCSHILCSPTRQEVDISHAAGKSIDVGTQSLRNLSMISTRRVVLWAILLTSSVPLHLFYNSVVFSTTSANYYIAGLVTDEFVNGGYWNLTRAEHELIHGAMFSVSAETAKKLISRIGDMQRSINSLVRMDSPVCIREYKASPFQSVWSDVLFVVPSSFNHTNGLLGLEIVDPDNGNLGSDPPRNNIGDRLPTEYCLARPTRAHCEVRVNSTLLVIVIACNALKCACLIVTAILPGFEPLATTGDAIASFLNHPEDHGMVEASMSTVNAGSRPGWQLNSTDRPLLPYKSNGRRQANVVSAGSWVTCVSLCFSTWLASLYLVVISLEGFYSREGAEESLMSAGFGDVTPALDVGNFYRYSLVARVLVANAPQLAISFVYIFYYQVLSGMLLGYDFSTFAVVRKGLRVSNPRGKQRPPFRLQLPYRYILPLMVAMVLLHWTVSRSLFLVEITVYHDPERRPGSTWTSTLGFSPLPVIISFSIGGLLLLVLAGFAMRKLRPGIPIVGSCSLAISATAYAGSSEESAAFKELMYGVILANEKQPHNQCAGFSSYEVAKLVNGNL